MKYRNLLTIIFIGLLITACHKDDSRNLDSKILNQVSAPLKHFDPHLNTGIASVIQLSKVYESLYETHPFYTPYEVIPTLAKGLPNISSDGLEYTFKIKDNVYFQDNPAFKGKKRKLKASDFETAFKRIADPKLVSPHYSYWKKQIQGLDEWYQLNQENDKTDYALPLKGVKALDDLTLKIKIKNRNNLFLHLLTTPTTAPLPQEVLEHYKNDLSQVMVGTGPFILKKYVRKSQLTFEKNPHYRENFFPKTALPKYKTIVDQYGGKKLPLLEKVNVKIINESQTSWLNFMKAKVDYLEVPKDNLSEAMTPSKTVTPEMKEKGISLGFTSSLTNIYYFGVNQKAKFLNNKKLKKAMVQAFDFYEFNKLFFNNTGDMAHSLLPPGIPGNNPPIKADHLEKNIEKAKILLKEAGFEGGKGLPEFVMMVKNKTISRQVGEFFQKEMKEIGIKVRVETVTWASLLERVQKGQFDFFYLAWFVGVPSAFEFFELLYGPNHPDSFNRMGYQNPKFDQLLEKSRVMKEGNEQEAIIHQLNKIALDDLPLFPLLHAKNVFIKQSWLKNYIPSEQYGGLEKYYDIDLKEKEKYLDKF